MRQEGEKTHTTEKSGSVLLFVSIELQLSDVIGLSHVCLFQHACLREKAGSCCFTFCVWMWFILVCHLCFVGRTQM